MRAVIQGGGETGLHLAVATMKVGEKAKLRVAARYGYGVAGSFSFPFVPPGSDLEYELELLGFDEVDEVRCGGLSQGGWVRCAAGIAV